MTKRLNYRIRILASHFHKLQSKKCGTLYSSTTYIKTLQEKYHQLEHQVQEYANKWLFNEKWTEVSNKNKYRNDLRQQVDR